METDVYIYKGLVLLLFSQMLSVPDKVAPVRGYRRMLGSTWATPDYLFSSTTKCVWVSMRDQLVEYLYVFGVPEACCQGRPPEYMELGIDELGTERVGEPENRTDCVNLPLAWEKT